MANIRSNTGGTTNIIETERGYKRVDFEKERERLANASTRTKDSNLCLPRRGGGKGTGLGR